MKWLKPNEVTEPGLYVFIFFGTNLQLPGFMEIKRDFHSQKLCVFRKPATLQPQENWSPNLRLCGPIPSCKE